MNKNDDLLENQSFFSYIFNIFTTNLCFVSYATYSLYNLIERQQLNADETNQNKDYEDLDVSIKDLENIGAKFNYVHLPICVFQFVMWIAIFQISTKYEDVFSFKKMVFVNIYTILTCGIELYAAYDTFNGVKNIEEFAFPCIHSVLSNITIYVFYMGMTLKLGAFNEFYQDFRYDLTAEEKMDEKLGLELSDDELEDFQKATSKQLTRAITI